MRQFQNVAPKVHDYLTGNDGKNASPMQDKIYQNQRGNNGPSLDRRHNSALRNSANQAIQPPPYGMDVGGQKMTKAQQMRLKMQMQGQSQEMIENGKLTRDNLKSLNIGSGATQGEPPHMRDYRKNMNMSPR